MRWRRPKLLCLLSIGGWVTCWIMKFGSRSLGIDLQMLVIECMVIDFKFFKVLHTFCYSCIFVAFSLSFKQAPWRAAFGPRSNARPAPKLATAERRDSGEWKDSGPPSPSVHASVARPQHAPSLVQPGAAQSKARPCTAPMRSNAAKPNWKERWHPTVCNPENQTLRNCNIVLHLLSWLFLSSFFILLRTFHKAVWILDPFGLKILKAADLEPAFIS